MDFKKLKELSFIIKGERSRQNLTQAEAASLCGVGTRFLSDLENGKETVHFGKVLQVLDGLGLSLSIREKTKNHEAAS